MTEQKRPKAGRNRKHPRNDSDRLFINDIFDQPENEVNDELMDDDLKAKEQLRNIELGLDEV